MFTVLLQCGDCMVISRFLLFVFGLLCFGLGELFLCASLFAGFSVFFLFIGLVFCLLGGGVLGWLFIWFYKGFDIGGRIFRVIGLFIGLVLFFGVLLGLFGELLVGLGVGFGVVRTLLWFLICAVGGFLKILLFYIFICFYRGWLFRFFSLNVLGLFIFVLCVVSVACFLVVSFPSFAFVFWVLSDLLVVLGCVFYFLRFRVDFIVRGV